MADPIGEVPPAYLVHRIGDSWLVLDREAQDALVALRLADAGARRALFSRAPRRGRGAAPSVPLAGVGAVVLRRYQHGGLFRRLTGRLFWGPGRAVEELRVTARAEASAAPVPHVLCLAAWPVLGPFWSALIGTREEQGASDLVAALAAQPSARARCRLAREVGAAVRRMHDAGVEHRDLQLGNLLAVETDGQRRIVVIDLDHARFHGVTPVDARRRARNLGRLARSGAKAGARAGSPGRRELAALLAGYTADDRALRAALRRFAGWERLKLVLHRASYRFRSAGAGPSRIRREAAWPPPRA